MESVVTVGELVSSFVLWTLFFVPSTHLWKFIFSHCFCFSNIRYSRAFLFYSFSSMFGFSIFSSIVRTVVSYLVGLNQTLIYQITSVLSLIFIGWGIYVQYILVLSVAYCSHIPGIYAPWLYQCNYSVVWGRALGVFAVHICHSYAVPDMVDFQDAILLFWAGKCNIFSVDWMFFRWQTLRLLGLGLLRHCCCRWLGWVVPEFINILRFLYYYLNCLPITVVVYCCSLLRWLYQYFNHSETHNQNFICLPRHHMGYNLNYCTLGLGQVHHVVNQIFQFRLSIQRWFQLLILCNGPRRGHGWWLH